MMLPISVHRTSYGMIFTRCARPYAPTRYAHLRAKPPNAKALHVKGGTGGLRNPAHDGRHKTIESPTLFWVVTFAQPGVEPILQGQGFGRRGCWWFLFNGVQIGENGEFLEMENAQVTGSWEFIEQKNKINLQPNDSTFLIPYEVILENTQLTLMDEAPCVDCIPDPFIAIRLG